MAQRETDYILTGRGAAEFLKLSWKTLARFRSQGGGPKYLRLSRTSIRYRMADLLEWLTSREMLNTSDKWGQK